MIRNIAVLFLYVSLLLGLPLQALSQTSAELDSYFKNAAGLSTEQIAEVRSGKALGKVLKSRTPDEIFVFGVVYIKAAPESYIKFANDFDRLKKLPEFVAIGKFSNPPQATDLEGFTFDSEDIKALKECKPHDCDVQMPAVAIEDVHKSINWSAPDLDRQVNQHLHERVVAGMQAYRQNGNQALGVYLDKDNPVDVSKRFEYMLSYVQVLPKVLPDFHHYLLAYPDGKSANIEDSFYWAKVPMSVDQNAQGLLSQAVDLCQDCIACTHDTGIDRQFALWPREYADVASRAGNEM